MELPVFPRGGGRAKREVGKYYHANVAILGIQRRKGEKKGNRAAQNA